MPIFSELIKDKTVKNHPLLQGYRNLPNIRESLNKHAQELGDMFSSPAGYQEEPKRDLRATIHEASSVVQDAFTQFEIPIFPKISYNNVKGLKYARHDDTQITDGNVLFNVAFKALSGVGKNASVMVPIVGGEVIPPSVMEVDGRMYTISQQDLNTVLGKVTAYELPPIRDQYEAPLDKEEREQAVANRNEMGWQPRKHEPRNYMMQDTRQASEKTAKGIPSAYKTVKEMMEKAEEDGLDSFPRPYIHVLKNYIMEVVNTASRDAWEPHLINQGFCINPYGDNRHRFHKGAQALGKDDFDKELEFEVDEPEEMIEDLPKGPGRFYMDTKTPIEPKDKVKFPHSSGSMRGVIVEINEDSDSLIVESNGDRYVIEVESVSPMPSTFKKMYR